MADAAAASKNVVKVEDAGPSLKKVHIKIPAESVTDTIRESFDTLALEAELPGFRKGKAPRKLVEKRFGAMIKNESKSRLVASAYESAVSEHKLRVIGDPVAPGLDKKDLEEGKAFEIEFEVEVMPEFTLPELDGVAIKKPIIAVTDEMVSQEFEKLRVNEGSLEPRDSSEPGDYCTGHGIMKGKDGTEFYNIPGAVIQIPPADKNGVGMILGVKVEDFSKQIGTLKPGATATVKVKGPENHEIEAVRGNDLTITFKVDRVDRIIPAPVDQLVSMTGFPDEASLKDALKQRLTQRATVQQQVVMRQQLARYLVEKTEVAMPARLSAAQAGRVLESRRMELMYRGVEPAQIEEHMAELRAAATSSAISDLKLFFILAKVAEDRKVRVDEAEVNGRIVQMAMERGVRPDVLRNELIKTNQVQRVVQQIVEHKAMDSILAKANVTEMSADDFNKAMEAESKASKK